MHNNTTQKGFTLIEMMIVATIIAILGVSTLPSTIQRIRKQTLVENTEQATYFIQEAANYARNSVNGSPWSITIDTAQNQLTRTCEACPTPVTESLNLDDQITLTSTFPNNYIIFAQNTARVHATLVPNQVLTTEATLTLTLSNFQTNVILNPAGTVESTNLQNI